MKKIDNPLDRIGILAAMTCAIHCMAMPLLLTVGTLSGFAWLTNLEVERWFIGVSIVIAGSSLLWSFFRQHRQPQALWIATLGIGLILGSHIQHTSSDHWLTALGGILLATAHLINWLFLSRQAPLFISFKQLWLLSFIVAGLLIYKFTRPEQPLPESREEFLELVWKKKEYH